MLPLPECCNARALARLGVAGPSTPTGSRPPKGPNAIRPSSRSSSGGQMADLGAFRIASIFLNMGCASC